MVFFCFMIIDVLMFFSACLLISKFACLGPSALKPLFAP